MQAIIIISSRCHSSSSSKCSPIAVNNASSGGSNDRICRELVYYLAMPLQMVYSHGVPGKGYLDSYIQVTFPVATSRWLSHSLIPVHIIIWPFLPLFTLCIAALLLETLLSPCLSLTTTRWSLWCPLGPREAIQLSLVGWIAPTICIASTAKRELSGVWFNYPVFY